MSRSLEFRRKDQVWRKNRFFRVLYTGHLRGFASQSYALCLRSFAAKNIAKGFNHMRDLIIEQIQAGIELRQACLEPLQTPLMQAADQMIQCLQSGGKILACGNGGSASDAMHFVAELVNRFEVNRPALAAIALVNDASVMTSIANDFEFNSVFSRQIEALGRKGDVLLSISTSGNSENVLKAMQKARDLDMQTIALTGHDGGSMINFKTLSTSIHIASDSTARVQEMHITCLHILCSIIDRRMFGI